MKVSASSELQHILPAKILKQVMHEQQQYLSLITQDGQAGYSALAQMQENIQLAQHSMQSGSSFDVRV